MTTSQTAQRELFIDCFAGGGGASIGIEQATGRSPDIAINHDAVALAMHAINHPGTLHLCTNIWKTDPDDIDGPIGGMWFSPDCTDHSKAKGGKPIRKHIRDLAWVVIRWLDRNKGGPRMFWLENVEEFQGWGPLVEVEPGRFMRCPDRIGQTFKRFVRECKRRGYAIEWREIRGCNYGTPTTRKRLFMIARNDGEPIIWPKETHAKPGSLPVTSAHAEPWNLAAGCIDWSLVCPSIFDTAIEIKEKHGLRANRPLALNTMARIARGLHRYVLEAENPFIVEIDSGDPRAFMVPVTHTGDERVYGTDEPFRTTTCAPRGEHALVTPFITKFRQNSTGTRMDEPLHTITANGHQEGGRDGCAATHALVTPFLARTAHGEVGQDGHRRGRGEHSVEEPIGTTCGSRDHAVVAPIIVGVGSRAGQSNGGLSSGRPLDAPAPTITATKRGQHALVAPVMVKNNHGDKPHYGADEPVRTIVAGGQHHMLVAGSLINTRNGEREGQAPRCLDVQLPFNTVTAEGSQGAVIAAFLAQHNTDMVGHDVRKPLSTIVEKGSTQAVVSAYLAQHNGDGHTGRDAREPVSTVTASGHQQAVVSAGLINLKGSDRRDSAIDEPAPTQTAGGWHIGQVNAFIQEYYGEGGQDQGCAQPLNTIPSRGRFGLTEAMSLALPLTPEQYARARTTAEFLRAHGYWGTEHSDEVSQLLVVCHGYIIVDIGMRMLTPRELFRANGAPDSYIIHQGIAVCDDEERGWIKGQLVPITKTQQISCCGNMVNPQVARALIAANYTERNIDDAGGVPAFALEG